MRTWHAEAGFVFLVLFSVWFFTGGDWIEAIGSLAVLASFLHAQVSDRLAGKQAQLVKPDVDCWQWAVRYFTVKEFLWLFYFILHRSYAALVGVALFLLYPVWRRAWVAHKRVSRLPKGETSCQNEDRHAE